MGRNIALRLCVGLLCVATYAQAQTTIIDPSRRVDWSQAGVPGGIPNRTTICATFSPGATYTQINNAIASCSNGVVFLNAGTYALSGGISFVGRHNVTLRGAGPDRTTLVFTGKDGCHGINASVCVGGSSSVWTGNVPAGNLRNWTAGYSKGTTQLTLSSTTGMTTGMILVLDQLDDAVETGGVLVSHDRVIENVSAGRTGRAQMQFVRVTAISGTTVTISPGLQMPNWRASQVPQAWWWGDLAATAYMNGVEDLTLDHTNNTGSTGIGFFNAYASWVKNVKSLNSNRNHVWLWPSARIEIRDSYFYGTRNAASQSYGVESYMASDTLVVNNIFQHITAPLMTGVSSGSVFAYNFLIDMYYTVASWMMAGIQGAHDVGSGMNLFEGNVANAFLMDLYHGPGALATVFRNRLTGTEGSKTSNTTAVSVWGYNRLVNVVGNVLGTAGYHTVYEDSRGPQGVAGNPNRSIYLLGYSGVDEETSSCCPYDSLVVSSLLRWGNYDYATNQARFRAAEIPAGNAVPANNTLPASLFLSAKPGWWGTMPWPAIGPDVTGGVDSAGHAHRIPAEVCYNTTPKTGGILNFNAANCYGNGPAPPTNLRTVP
jgi:hypothetical protein